MNLANANILVTGGGGFIGSHIVDELLKEKVKNIIVLDNFVRGRKENLNNALLDKRVKLIIGDIRNVKLVDNCMKNIDFVFHQAALRHTQCTDDPLLGHEVLADGTFTIFYSAAKHSVKKIIFASSASVYGDPFHLPMKETDAFNDNTFYGAAKIYNERLAIAFKSRFNLSFVGFRYFNVYGPRMDIHGVYTEVLIRWLDQLKNGQSPIIYGDGKQSMDFVYVKDVAMANIKGIKSQLKEGIFNVGSGRETTLKELLLLVLKLTKNSNTKPIIKPAKKHALANKRRADIFAISSKLKFRQQTTLENGLQSLITWYFTQNKQLVNNG